MTSVQSNFLTQVEDFGFWVFSKSAVTPAGLCLETASRCCDLLSPSDKRASWHMGTSDGGVRGETLQTIPLAGQKQDTHSRTV